MTSKAVTTKILKSTFSHLGSKFLATAKAGLAHYDSFRGGWSQMWNMFSGGDPYFWTNDELYSRRFVVVVGFFFFFFFFFGCLTSQQQANVSQGLICSDNLTRCHTETEVADQTFYLTQSQYTDTRPTSPNEDPIVPGAWQGSHWR